MKSRHHNLLIYLSVVLFLTEMLGPVETFAQCSAAPTIGSPTATSITTNSVILGATVSDNGGTNGCTADYGVRYSTSTPVGSTNETSVGSTTSDGDPPFTTPIMGLLSGTKYYYTGYATNNSGTNTTLDNGSVFFYTLETAPGAEPGGFTFTATGSTSQIALAFDPASDWSADGYIIFRKAGGVPSTTTTDGADPSGFTDYLATVLNSAQTSYNDVSAVAGISYTYAIVPVNAGSDLNTATFNYGTASVLTPSATRTLELSISNRNTPGSHGVATDGLVASSIGKAILGFALTSNGPQDVSLINIRFDADPDLYFNSYSLVESIDDILFEGTDPTIPLTSSNVSDVGGGFFEIAIDPTADLTITTTERRFFLVVNVNNAVASAANVIQATLPSTGIAGNVTGSATGIDYDMVALTLTIANRNTPATHGVASATLAAGASNRAILGFALTSNGTEDVSLIKINFTADPDLYYENYRLVESVDDIVYEGTDPTISLSSANVTDLGGGNWEIALDPTADLTITTERRFFLVIDVDPAVTPGNNVIQASLNTNGISVVGDIGTKTGSATGINYSFAALTATLAQLATGIAGSPLIAGTTGTTSQNAILGFSLASNGDQTVTSIKVAFDTDPTGKFTSYGLIQSSDNSFASTVDNSTVALTSSNISGTGPYYVDLVPTTALDISAIKNLFLVVTVNGGINSTTLPSTLTPSLSTADITVGPSTFTPNSFNGTTYSFQASQASTIAIHTTAGTTSPINFALYSAQTATSGLTWGATPNSTSLANFRIRDGGGSADSDAQDTKVTSFTITISNPQDLQTVAVFYGTSINNANIKVGEQPVGAGTLTFSVGAATLSQALTASDGNDAYFTIRTTFKSIFSTTPDNNTHVVAVTAATVDLDGSQLSASPLTLATTGAGASINNITVVATKVVFTNAMPITTNPATDFSATINATDANGNLDVNQTSSVTLSATGGPGTLTTTDNTNYPLTKNLVAGTFTWQTLQIDLAFPTYTLNGNHATFTGGNDATGTVKVISPGPEITKANLTSCIVGSNNFFTELDSIVIAERDPSDFNAGTDKTFMLLLPSGWEFLTPAVSDPTPSYSAPDISYTTSSGADLSSATFSGFISKTAARFTLSIGGTSDYDTLTIKGLFIKNVSATEPDSILRSGTAVIEGVDETVNLGTLQRSQGAPVNFDVEAQPGFTVSPGQVKFAISDNAVILAGKIGNSTIYQADTISFSGNGVSYKLFGTPINGNRFIFSPSSTVPGIIPITMIYRDTLNGCLSDTTKEFTVYSNAIQGIQDEMCRNDSTPHTMTVNSLNIPPGYSVDSNTPFKYEDPNFVNQLAILYPPTDLIFYKSGNPTVPGYTSAGQISNITWNPINPSTGQPFSVSYNNFPSYNTGYYYGYDGICCYNYIYGPKNSLTPGFTYYFGTTFIQLTIPNHGLINGEKLTINSALNGSFYFSAGYSITLYTGYPYYTVRVVDANNIIINMFEAWGYSPNVDGAQYYGYIYGNMNSIPPYNMNTSRIDRLDTKIRLRIPNHTLTNGDQMYIFDYYGAFNSTKGVHRQPLTITVVDANYVDVDVKEAEGVPTTLIFNPDYYNYYTYWYFTGFLSFPGNLFDNSQGFPYKGAARGTSLKDEFVPSNYENNWSGNTVTVADFLVDGAGRKKIENTQKVTLLSPPVVDFTGLGSSYCSTNGQVSLTTSYADDGLYSAQPNFGIEDGANGTGIFRPADIPPAELGNPISITYTVTDTKGCVGTSTKVTVVQSQLNPPLALDTAYCQGHVGSIIINATGEPGSTIRWFDDPGLTVPLGVGENLVTNLDPNSPVTKPYFATQEAPGYCQSTSATGDVTIKQAPPSNFDLPPGCVDREFSVSCPEGSVQCDWNFGDGVTAVGDTVTHTYSQTGTPTIVLKVTAADGCTGTTGQQLGVGPNPTADFSFDQICDGDNTEFHAISDGTSFSWDFGDGNTSPEDPSVDRTNTFGAIGNYDVAMTAYFNNGCYTDTTKTVPILNYLIGFDENNPYVMANLDGGKGFWKIEDVNGNSTWEFAVANKTIIKSTSDVWVTNSIGNYLENDRSFVNSPCLDISGLTRPVISLDYIENTQIQSFDGAVLEYSVDGGKTWVALGSTTTGANWYNTQGFFSGNIGSSQVGWSGDLWNTVNGQTEWKQGKHKLDDIPNQSKVRLRLAFASNQDGEFEGFAFTNLQILDRNRLILLENFTNNIFSDNNTNFITDIDDDEAVKVQYHLSYPNPDDINLANQPDPSARSAYYGISYNTQNVPRGYVDGFSGGNFITADWVDASLDERSLITSPYSITISTLDNSADPTQIKIKVDVNRLLPVTGIPVLHVAVVEDDDGINQNVLRKLLPSAAGTYLAGLDTEEFEFSWEPSFSGITLDNVDDLSIVAFIQDQVTKEVHQAAIDSSHTFLPSSIITGIEDPAFADKIQVYPNPASHELNVVLPQPATINTPLTLMDAQGRIVFEGALKTGQQRKTINTGDLAGGVFILQVQAKETMVRKKVMVVHSGN